MHGFEVCRTPLKLLNDRQDTAQITSWWAGQRGKGSVIGRTPRREHRTAKERFTKPPVLILNRKLSNFVFEYIDKIETKFQMGLACLSGAMWH